MQQFNVDNVDDDIVALVWKLAKPKPFENLTFNGALRRVFQEQLGSAPAKGNTDDLEELLLALHTDDFQKTVPNCKINDIENQDYVDADQYESHWDETNCARCAYPSNKTLSFSLKIAIVTSLQGPLSGLVTFHFSGSSG